MTAAPLKVSLLRDERVLQVHLARPKANIIDGELIQALGKVLEESQRNDRLKAVLLGAEGAHFSFGASVEEHLPDQCAAMLEGFHRLILHLAGNPVPVLVAVRGQCLGGGLELAMAGHLIFAAPDTQMGQPEIKLGVFAPAASCLLPLRIGRMPAEDMLLSGRSLSAGDALQVGLVTAIAEDPDAAALEYYDTHLAPLSASSLRVAVRAARAAFTAELRKRLAEVETLYLRELMSTHDAVEGLDAFLERRPPEWKDR
jgi:cyclohexa-1,5-dienecarbonyl-CoA hydratase